MELDTGEIIEIIRENVTDETLRGKLIAEINEAEKKAKKELAASKEIETGPKAKNKFVVLFRGDSELAAKIGGAWLVQIPEEGDATKVVESLTGAAARSNEAIRSKKSNRGRKSKGGLVRSWRELFAWTKSKFTKEFNVRIKTKDAVEVVVLPDEDVKFSS